MHKHTQWMETQTHILYYNKYVHDVCMYGSITTVVHTRYASISKENPYVMVVLCTLLVLGQVHRCPVWAPHILIVL